MGEEKNVSLAYSSPDGYNMGMLMLACIVLSWMFIPVWNQRNKKGPKSWPLVGAAIEQLMNYDSMHDWLVKYLSESKTVVVPMPFTTYTYIADPANVEYVLKTNFANYPKVEKTLFIINIIFCVYNCQKKMINVHHMYNKGTTPLLHGVSPTHCGVHPM
jgi:hypothetical protein